MFRSSCNINGIAHCFTWLWNSVGFDVSDRNRTCAIERMLTDLHSLWQFQWASAHINSSLIISHAQILLQCYFHISDYDHCVNRAISERLSPWLMHSHPSKRVQFISTCLLLNSYFLPWMKPYFVLFHFLIYSERYGLTNKARDSALYHKK